MTWLSFMTIGLILTVAVLLATWLLWLLAAGVREAWRVFRERL